MPTREHMDCDDVFSDLLKTASVIKIADDPINADRAMYKGSPVVILERESGLSRILPEGGDESDAFWAKTINLKPFSEPRKPRQRGVPLPPPKPDQNIIPVENRLVPAEWRVSFKAPDPTAAVQYSYPHDVAKGSGQWRVNYKDFARYLILRGFILGTNAPKSKLPQTE